ncbi:hypothetical protein C8F01DRAFT_1238545 [Mycena amicta]|nr:hypothetical protein C8F01DRAFT_1238545 [Mycena amicta]
MCRGMFDTLVGSAENVDAFRLDGIVIAMTLLNFGGGMSPLCPITLLALTQPDTAFFAELDLAFIHLVDPASAAILAPWFAIDETTVLEPVSTHPMFPLLNGYLSGLLLALRFLPELLNPVPERCGSDPEGSQEVSVSRDPEGDEEPEGLGLCRRTSGVRRSPASPETGEVGVNVHGYNMSSHHIYGSSEFNALRNRFNLVLSPGKHLADNAPVIVAFGHLFQLHLLRWLKGVGYPSPLRGGLIPQEEYDRASHDGLLRANRFLHCMVGHYFLPADPGDNFEVKLNFHNDGFGPDRAMYFHACARYVEVFFTDVLRHALLQDFDYDDTSLQNNVDYNQPPPPTQLNTIREEYHQLEVRVRRSLQIQLGDAARLSHRASQATRLLRMAEQHSALFPPGELDMLRQNIEQMLSSLASARDQSADPPSASSLVVLRKVPNGKGTGRPRLQIDSQFLGSTLNVLRGPTGIAKGDWVLCSYRLATEVADILQRFPSFGREMLSGALAARGLRVPRDRIKASYLRVHGPPRAFGSYTAERERDTYYVPGSILSGTMMGSTSLPCHTSVTPIGLRAHFQPTLVSPLRLLFKQWVLTQ